jgi:hypothetical protein
VSVGFLLRGIDSPRTEPGGFRPQLGATSRLQVFRSAGSVGKA